ncbi:MAG: hypothetical protein M3Q00_01095 [Pseudomonadota bacterium]|nr:hypothetical protein [Pseudomonadota bacterium]
MKLINLTALTLLVVAAGCGGGGGGGSSSSGSDAFVAGVQTIVNSSADEDEPIDISNTVEASDDDAEPLVL